MYFRQLVYLLGYFTCSQAASTVIAYFGDPSIQASGSWSEANACGNVTSTVGGSVTVSFTGTGVTFVGPLQGQGGLYSFTLDDQPAVTFDDYRPTGGGSSILCNQVLYRSSSLTNGPHKLTASLTGRSPSGGGSIMAMEYFAYTIPDSPTSPSSPSETGTTASAPPSTDNSQGAKVPGGVTFGILVGGAALGSLVFAFGVFAVPTIRRKALSQGSITGEPPSGLYRILNEKYLNVAAASDANDVSPIVGISYGRIPDHKWDIIRQENGRYQIKNHGHSSVYIGWNSAQPQVGEDIVNNLKSDVEWNIEETQKGSRKYRIYTAGTNEKLYWSLSYDNRGTPITLLKSSNDTGHLWTLSLLEPLHSTA